MLIELTSRKPLLIASNGKLSVHSVMEEQNFKHIDPLDIENFETAGFKGVEFNNLYLMDNSVIAFQEWESINGFMTGSTGNLKFDCIGNIK